MFIERVAAGPGGHAEIVRALETAVRESRAAALVIVPETTGPVPAATKVHDWPIRETRE